MSVVTTMLKMAQIDSQQQAENSNPPIELNNRFLLTVDRTERVNK
jgi:hypothetical protein